MLLKITHSPLTVVVVLIFAPMTIDSDRSLVNGQRQGMRPCKPERNDTTDPNKIVCVCTIDYCDNLVFELPQPGELLKVESNQEGERFKLNYTHYDKECPNDNSINSQGQCQDSDDSSEPSDYVIKLQLDALKQTILGWGGAFTDASVINMDKFSEEFTTVLLENYFGSNGLRYDIGRVPIAGTDFSNHSYTYDDVDNSDYELEHWSLAPEDTELKMPYIKRARQLTKDWEGNLRLFASSWSPPAWMKTNNSTVRGFLKGPSTSDGKVYQAYANYLVKFLKAYRDNDLPMWGMTVQNEPGSAFLPFYFFNSLEFPANSQIDFIKYHLGPMLEQEGLNKTNFKLIVGDDSVGFVNIMASHILREEQVRQYVSGLAFHWYLSGILPYSLVESLYETNKDYVEFMLMTEACTGSMPNEKAVILGDWSRAVQYARDIILDLNMNAAGWIDWNLALDLQGGPNWSGNFVDSPIIVEEKEEKFYKNPMYYALGHFSRFIPTGSRRIESNIDVLPSSDSFFNYIYGGEPSVIATAFMLPSQKHASLVLLNTSDRKKVISIEISSEGSLRDNITNVQLSPQSITTLVYGL